MILLAVATKAASSKNTFSQQNDQDTFSATTKYEVRNVILPSNSSRFFDSAEIPCTTWDVQKTRKQKILG